jgi:ketosteroid isomerase-like protein
MTCRHDRPAATLFAPLATAFAALLLASLPPLYAWAVRWMLRRNLARLWAGDPEPLLATYAEDVRFVFPGRSSWSADLQGKDAVRRWLGRFVGIGLRFEVREILVAGPPWDTTACLWFTDRLVTPDGDVVYENHGTILAKIAWGKVTYYEVNEDTQKVAELDEYLEAHGSRGQPAGA